jgi:hypothetical protein
VAISVGETVSVVAAYAEAGGECHYVPNLIYPRP